MGRPSGTPLTRESIFRTALQLVDDHGAAALSTNRIAAELDVKGPSLYNHVSGRADIIEGMLELLVAEMDFSGADLRPWTVACEHLTRAYRNTLAAHPDVLPLIADLPIRSPDLLDAYDRAFGVLRDAGWRKEQLTPLVRSMEYLAIGSALDRSFDTPGEADQAFEFGLASMIAGLEIRLTEGHPMGQM